VFLVPTISKLNPNEALLNMMRAAKTAANMVPHSAFTYPLFALHALSSSTSASFHEWLPGRSERHGQETFISLAKESGVSRIAMIRHGKTAPRPPQTHDFDRVLTEEGKQQAKLAGSTYGSELMPFFPIFMVSPAPRTMDTANIFLEATGISVGCLDLGIHLEPVQSLYEGTMQPEGSRLFQKIGYAPLRDYLMCEDDEDRKTAQSVLGTYAHTVTDEIIRVLEQAKQKSISANNQNAQGLTLCLVAHAIYLPAAALGVATLADCDAISIDLLLRTNTREAEGYLINLNAKTVTYLARPDERPQSE